MVGMVGWAVDWVGRLCRRCRAGYKHWSSVFTRFATSAQWPGPAGNDRGPTPSDHAYHV